MKGKTGGCWRTYKTSFLGWGYCEKESKVENGVLKAKTDKVFAASVLGEVHTDIQIRRLRIPIH